MPSTVPQVATSFEPLEPRQLLSVSLDAQGWTLVTPSADSRIVYVSSSGGSDTNSGLSPATPVQSLSKASSLLRSGMPDWVLLKAGDVWSGEGIWVNAHGRGQQEPILVSAYGTGDRPLLVNGRIQVNGDHVAVTGLHLQGPGKFNSPNLEGIELTWNQNRTDVLFEDLRVEGYKVGMNVRLGQQITVRRSAIHDNALIGLAANDNDGLLIEENVIDNNGIDQNTNHNIYKGPRTNDVIVRNNVITRGGNYGLKWRAPSGGGEISGNLFAGNRNDLSLHLDTEDAPDLMNDDIRILNNVFVESGRGDQQTPIFLAHASNILVQGNLIANMNSTPYGQAIRLAYNLAAPNSLSDVRITGNTVANFTGTGFGLLTSDYARVRVDGNTFQGLTRHNVSVRAEFRPADLVFQGNTYHTHEVAGEWFELGYHNYLTLDAWPAGSGEADAAAGPVLFPDDTRTLSTYDAALGGAGTLGGFLAEAVRQSRGNWRGQYAAQAAVNYVRQGFGLAPITELLVTPLGAPTTTEAGGTATYQVTLNRQPANDVTIPVSTSDASEAAVSVNSITFTPDNWNIPQFITVTGLADGKLDADVAYKLVLGAALSNDTSFAGLDAPDRSLTNLNLDLDDVAPRYSFNNGGSIKMIRSTSVSQKTGYRFTVQYADNSGIDVASLATGNLVITGPDGYNQLPSFVAYNVQEDGSVVATYRFNPPGATWDVSDNALYRVKPGPSPAADIAGNAAVADTTGTLIVYITTEPQQPSMTVGLEANAVTNTTILKSESAYTFKVNYLPDEFDMKAGSISNNDIKVVNDKGFVATATLVYRKLGTRGSIIAKYRIVPPGGTWNASDNTTYTISLQKREVRDVAGHYVPGGKLGKFRVKILASGGSVIITPEPVAPSEAPETSSLPYESVTRDLFNTRTRILDAA